MRRSTSPFVFALLLAAVAGPAAAQNGSIGVYADVTATQTSTTFSIGVPRSIFIVAQLAGETEFGTTGAEFFVDGFPQDWLVFVTPNSAAGVVLGNPLVETGGVRRANLAFPACMNEGTGRVLLYSRSSWRHLPSHRATSWSWPERPPTNPSIASPILTKCDPPNYTLIPVQGGSFQFEVRAPQDLDYSSLPGFDGERGVQPTRGMPGDVFHFRALYTNSALVPPAAGSPRVELDANGDGDVLDAGEGAFTMSPADLDSTLANGKEYRYDVALGEPPGGMYRYRFTAVDASGTPVAGAATTWRESLFVNSDQMDLRVRAADIRALPPQPLVDQISAIVARIENRSDRRAANKLDAAASPGMHAITAVTAFPPASTSVD